MDFSETEIIQNLEALIESKSSKIEKQYFDKAQWSFEDNSILKLKSKIEIKGVPFISWKKIAINRGVTTGANSIFIIKDEIKKQLCLLDSSSSEIIKPLLKGRDVKRYNAGWSGEWIIFTRRGINIELYPAVKDYLEKFKNELEPGVGRKSGNYKWYEIQDNTAYFNEFEKKKLIWSRLSNINPFAVSESGEFSLDSTSFAVTNDCEYLCAILNSKVVLFYFKLGSVIWGKDGIKWFGEYFDNIPIPQISPEAQTPFIEKVNQILALKKADSGVDTSVLEAEIDRMVYQLYDLTAAEILIVEGK